MIGVLYGLGVLGMVLAGAVGLGLRTDIQVIALLMGVLGALLVAGWAVVPLLVTGVDSTLDPRAMAAWTAPSRGLAIGLLAAGALGVPGCLTAVICLVPALTWLVAGQILAALLALLCAPAALATCIILSRIVVTAVGVSSSRRGRETTAIIAFLSFLVATQLPNLIPRIIGDDIAGFLERLKTIAQVMGLTPFGWGFTAPGLIATGSALPALMLMIGAWIVPVALFPVWQRVVGRVMTSPGTAQTRTRAYSSRGRRIGDGHADPRGEGQIDVLPWAHRLGSVLPRPAAAVAARCLRYWRTDPRYLVQLLSILLVPVILVLVPALNSSRFVIIVNGQRLGGSLALISAGTSGAHDRLGRVAGAALWQVPLLIAVEVTMGAWTGYWAALPAVSGACLALYGCALGWSCLTNVLLPYETLAPGDSPMRSRTSGTALLASIVQAVAMLLLLAVCSPVLGAAAYGVVQGSPMWGWAALVLGGAWCSLALWGGVVVGGRLLDRRGPQVLATIRSWPGHAQPV